MGLLEGRGAIRQSMSYGPMQVAWLHGGLTALRPFRGLPLPPGLGRLLSDAPDSHLGSWSWLDVPFALKSRTLITAGGAAVGDFWNPWEVSEALSTKLSAFLCAPGLRSAI